MREEIYRTNSTKTKLVLNALSPGKGNEFESPIISRAQRENESSPAIRDHLLNSMNRSTLLFHYQEADITPLFYNYKYAYLLNGLVFGNGRRKDVGSYRM